MQEYCVGLLLSIVFITVASQLLPASARGGRVRDTGGLPDVGGRHVGDVAGGDDAHLHGGGGPLHSVEVVEAGPQLERGEVVLRCVLGVS